MTAAVSSMSMPAARASGPTYFMASASWTMFVLLLAATARLDRRAQPFALALFASALAMGSTAYGIWQPWWMSGFLAAALMLRLAARIGEQTR